MLISYAFLVAFIRCALIRRVQCAVFISVHCLCPSPRPSRKMRLRFPRFQIPWWWCCCRRRLLRWKCCRRHSATTIILFWERWVHKALSSNRRMTQRKDMYLAGTICKMNKRRDAGLHVRQLCQIQKELWD